MPKPSIELYKAAPSDFDQSQSSMLEYQARYSGELRTPRILRADNIRDIVISSPYTDSQGCPPFEIEETFAFRREDVPISFGGLSDLPGQPLDLSESYSAASLFSKTPRLHSRKLKSSAPSSFGSDMTDNNQYLAISEHDAVGGRASASTARAGSGFHVHESKKFSPGCVVKLTWFDDSEMDLDDIAKLSDEDFIRRRRARKGTIRLFVLFKTYPDYSMAVPIHTYSREELTSPAYSPKHHAVVYTAVRAPPLQTGEQKSPNPPIRVEATEELSALSRINYAGVFTIEHTFPLAFVGKICKSHWTAFSTSYATVQSMVTPYDVQPPSAEREDASDLQDPESPASCGDTFDTWPAAPYTARAASPTIQQLYDNAGSHSRYIHSDSNLQGTTTHYSDPMRSGGNPPAIQVFQAPSSLDSNANATTSGPTTGFSTQGGTSSASSDSQSGFYGSEEPLHQFHFTSKTAKVGQENSPHSVHHAQCGLETLRLDYGIPPMVQCFTGTEQIAAVHSLRRIQDTSKLRLLMMNSIQNQQGDTIRNLCSTSSKSTFPRRVRVAILDSATNIYSPVFNRYRHRIKGFYDFIGDFQPPPDVSHGMHVASLLLNMAPDVDLYFARALEERKISQGGDPNLLTQAVKYAVKTWEVDIISISGGMHQQDDDLEDALTIARRRKVAVFAATHNSGKTKQMAFPARDPTVIGISASDYLGNPVKSAAQPKEDKANFAALGEHIPAFWMGNKMEPLKGSSFATPIAVGIYATTLLAARLSFREDSEDDLRQKLRTHAVKDRLMLALSIENREARYHNVDPEALWSGDAGYTEGEIRRHIDQVKRGLPYR